MKHRILGLIILLVFCFGIVGVYAEEPKDQLYFIYYTAVEPSMADKFEANLKKFIAEYTKHNLKYGITAYSTNDFDYYFLIPINNYAERDEMDKAFAEVRTKMGTEKYDALWNAYGGTYKYNRNGFYTFRADLSFDPETPRVKPEERNFIIWLNYYVKTGKMPEFEKVIEEWISFYKSKNIDTGFYNYVGGIGTEEPYISCAVPDKNAVELFAQSAKKTELYPDKFADLWKKTFSLLRKYEQKMGRPRPDLSYTPKSE